MVRKTEFRVRIANEPGNLWRVCNALHKSGINIRTIAGIAGQDILAIVTDQEDATRKIFNMIGLDFEEFDLIILRVTNMPGEIAFYAKKLADAGVNIDSVYMVGEANGKGEMALAVDDAERAGQVLGF